MLNIKPITNTQLKSMRNKFVDDKFAKLVKIYENVVLSDEHPNAIGAVYEDNDGEPHPFKLDDNGNLVNLDGTPIDKNCIPKSVLILNKRNENKNVGFTKTIGKTKFVVDFYD